MLYEKPKLEILFLQREDVVRTSWDDGTNDNSSSTGGNWAG